MWFILTPCVWCKLLNQFFQLLKIIIWSYGVFYLCWKFTCKNFFFPQWYLLIVWLKLKIFSKLVFVFLEIYIHVKRTNKYLVKVIPDIIAFYIVTYRIHVIEISYIMLNKFLSLLTNFNQLNLSFCVRFCFYLPINDLNFIPDVKFKILDAKSLHFLSLRLQFIFQGLLIRTVVNRTVIDWIWPCNFAKRWYCRNPFLFIKVFRWPKITKCAN